MSSLPPPPGDLPLAPVPATSPETDTAPLMPPLPPALLPPEQLPPEQLPPAQLPPPGPPAPPAPPVFVPSASVRLSVEPTPKRRRTGLWLALLGVVAVGAAVTIAVLAGGDDAVTVATTTTVDGADALETWQAIVDDVEFDAGSDGSGGEMDTCPFGDLTDWAANAPSAVTDAVDDVADGEEYLEVFISGLESDEQYLVQCLYYDEATETQIGLAITSRLDTDYRAELSELLGDFDVVFDPDRSYAGGTLVSYCTGVDDSSEQLAFCEADWYDDDILITLYFSDEEATSDTAAAWMETSLPDWLEDFADADLQDVDVTTVTY